MYRQQISIVNSATYVFTIIFYIILLDLILTTTPPLRLYLPFYAQESLYTSTAHFICGTEYQPCSGVYTGWPKKGSHYQESSLKTIIEANFSSILTKKISTKI